MQSCIWPISIDIERCASFMEPYFTLVSVPVVTLPMDEIQGSTLMGSIAGNLPSSATIVPGMVAGALYTNGLDQVVDYGDHRTQCFHQPDRCTEGVTFSMWLKIMSSSESVVFDCGGLYPDSIGYAMRRTSGGAFRVGVQGETTVTSTDILSWNLNEWVHLVVTYERSAGVQLYKNGCQLGRQNTPRDRTSTITRLPHLFLGGRAYGDDKAEMAMDNMLIWHEILTAGEIWQIYSQGGTLVWFKWLVPWY